MNFLLGFKLIIEFKPLSECYVEKRKKNREIGWFLYGLPETKKDKIY